MTRLLKVAGAFCLATVVVTAPLTCGAPAKALSVTAAPLPATRLEFGLSNFDVSWMTGSGVPWRYRFTYLAGGVNTSGNWFTWQDPAKPVGQYALDYMTSSTAPPASYIPVFTWYQLLQSNPSTGSSELDRDYNNLNNASTMSSYYASFKVLMQKAGQYSRQVVVHVEPDFWGYMQQKAAGGVATSVAASVRSSGFAEAAGFPDNVPGFASELKYLRDTYAPNALLAMHASMWSSSIDIASDTRTTIDAAAEADKSAAFLNSAGAAAWDAVFNDVDDHNAAWWELASCGMPPCVNQRFSHWWDTSNNTFPNFARYMTWVGELHARTLKPQVVWQVPMGNQYFLTMNNTCGHYQDNVAPYFIAHPNDLFSAGLVAVMFGPGNSCQTSYDDSRDDGITNNGGAATSDSLGGCGACNTHASTYADDDGGYIRIFVGNYYAGLSPCLGVSVDEAPPSPQVPGIAIVLAATATGCSGPLFQFWVLPPGGRWAVAQPFSRASTFSWNTTAKVPGVYRFSVWARDANSPGVSGTPPNTYDAFDAFDYVLSSAVCTGMSVVATPAESASVGTRVSLSGSPSGCPNPRYAFYLLPPGGPWSQVQTYSTNPTWSWNTAGKAPGSYRFSVWARDASSSAAYDAFQAFQYSLTVAPCSGIDVTTTPDGSAAGGTTVSVSGAAAGCPNPQYAFYLLPPGGVWALVRGYSSNRILSWSTTGKAAGTYRFSVWARDASSAAPYDAFSAFNYTLT